MVYGYCLNVVPCKISSSWLEKQQSYGQFKDIWFGFVWLSLVWFGFEWYGTWVLSRCSSLKNFELLDLKKRVMANLIIFGMVWYGMVWLGMVWFGFEWYGVVWYGMVWYGMVWLTGTCFFVSGMCIG